MEVFNAAPSGEQRERKRKLAPVSNSKGNTQFYFEEDYIILTDPHTSLTSSSKLKPFCMYTQKLLNLEA